MIQLKQYDWLNLSRCTLLYHKSYLKYFILFLFVLILQIVCFEVSVFIVETIAKDRVVSQFITIQFFYLCVFILQDIPIFLLLLFSFSLSCILYLEVVFSNSVVSVATDSIFWGEHCYTTSPNYHIWWSCFICLDISDCDFWSHCLHRWNRR